MLAASKTGEPVPPEPAAAAKELVQRRPNRRRRSTSTNGHSTWRTSSDNAHLSMLGLPQWTGMGNQELLEYFRTYMAVKARHSYGPQGHRGISVLIFEATVIGYLEAERLHKHFSEEGRDRDAWECRRALFYPGGKRQLYGYLACNEDMDTFNQHSYVDRHGKPGAS